MDNEQILKDLFDKSQENNDKMQFSSEEANRFKKAFDDPEFRKLFSEYVDELSDPKNRQETEAYISQLEGEQKVPEGKELIRPEPAFVVKSYKTVKNSSGSSSDKGREKEKMFLNIVQSLKIDEPSKSITPKGTCWSVPYSVGPPHMEKDKSGSNSPCFDCCFHPEALRLCSKIKEFKELVIHTAMEGVEQSYKRQGQEIDLDRDFHVVKGVTYKDGQVPTMMIAMSSRSNWKPDSESQPDLVAASSASSLKAAGSAATQAQDCVIPVGAIKPTAPAIKKGFLSGAKTALYGDKLTTIRPKTTPLATDPLPKSTIKLTRDAAPEQSALAVDGDLSLSRARTSRAGTAAAANGLIQEVQPGTSNAARSSVSSRPSTTTTATTAAAGLKELSSSRKTAPSTSQSAASSINSNSVPLSGVVAEVGDIISPSPGASVTGLREPKYTFKERGSLSLGDFELSNSSNSSSNSNSSANVRSNRPSELVYRIELPGIKHASQIVLDVAERQLNLSYPDMYALSLKLPYPVFDGKGTAKFDKGGSALNVTLPVQPRKQQQHCDPPSSSPTAGNSFVDSSSVLCSAEDNAAAGIINQPGIDEVHRPVQAVEEATSTNCDRSSVQSKHGRWISSEAGSAASSPPAPPINAVIDAGGVSPGDGVGKELSLRDEIKWKAELALKEASERSRKEATHRPICAAMETTTTTTSMQDLSKEEMASSSLLQRFIPSQTFGGARKGYVFKRDDEGLGYYLDDNDDVRRQMLTRASSGGVNDYSKRCPSSIDLSSRQDTAGTISSDESLLLPLPLLPFDFDCRQTKQAIAVLVQVPSIDAASVHVEFAPHQLRVSFRAVGPDGLLPGLHYGMTLDISPQSTCLVGFDPDQCKYDVACHNMAIVLVKSMPAYWSVKTSTTTAAAGGGDSSREDAAAVDTTNSVTGESKSSADYELQATKELLRVRPYEAVKKKMTREEKNHDDDDASPQGRNSSLVEAAAAPERNNKVLPKSLESMIVNMQFSSSAVLFDLD